MERFYHTLNIAIDAVLANKFRSILTALGIIFGVAAVIAMMAIGNGARQEILDQQRIIIDAEDALRRLINLPEEDWDRSIEPADMPEVPRTVIDESSLLDEALQQRDPTGHERDPSRNKEDRVGPVPEREREAQLEPIVGTSRPL